MKIGITYTGRDDKQSNYINWIKGNDPTIEIVKLAPGEHNNVASLDGLVLSGGVDIHPEYFNGDDQYDNMPKKFWRERDEFEFSAFDNAVKNGVPVLGVCRGLQLINVFQKGTLVQDLSARNKDHETYKLNGAEHDQTHHVTTEKNTLLNAITGDEGIVNSAHHQSIDTLGENLVANSHSDDGVIEGIEWKEKNGLPFMLAVQWHPERMDKAGILHSPFSEKIREHFLSAVKSSR